MSEKQQKIWVAAGLVLAGAIAYADSLGGPFIFDDLSGIRHNPNIVQLWPLTKSMWAPKYNTLSGRSIVSLSVALNYAISGYSVWSYHLFNVMIHIFAGLALYGVVRLTLLSERLRGRFGKHSTILAGIVAGIWVVHPLATQSVTYIVQRAESMMGLFYLLTLYAAIRVMNSEKRVGWSVLSIICCGLGMACKEVMATAPVLVLLYDRTFIAWTFKEALRKRWPLYLGLAVTWAVLGTLVLSVSYSEQETEFTLRTSLEYAMNEGAVILHYLRLAVWPSGLCTYYEWPTETDFLKVLPSLLPVLGLLAVTLWGIVRNSLWSYPAAWFFGILSVTSSFVPIWILASEHRMYLSLAGVAVLIVLAGYVLLEYLVKRFLPIGDFGYRVGVFLAAAVIVVLAVLTLQRNYDYRSSESIWRATVKASPLGSGAHAGLGAALAAQGRDAEAMECYLRAIEILPRCVVAYYNLGNLYYKFGRYEEAVEAFKKAVEFKPTFDSAYNNLGLAYNGLGRYEEAVAAFEQAIKCNPDHAEAYSNMGMIYWQQGRFKEAAQACKNALKIKPDYAAAHYGLGLSWFSFGEPNSAMEEYKILKTLDEALANELYKQIHP